MTEPLEHTLALSTWDDQLIWCPSQCYLYFTWNSQLYCLYLRWRHDDPWTADLIQCVDGGIVNGEWYELDVPFHIDEDIEGIKKSGIEKTIEFLNKQALKGTK
jgi:hypothetical protein